MKNFFLSICFAATTIAAQAQDLKLPSMSPTAHLMQEFSTSSIDITYSRPSLRGRKMFGALIPYGTIWRTGANGATKIKIGEDMTIGGQMVKAGEYSLYTIPGKEEWEVIINKQTGNWSNGFDKADDVARFKVKAEMTDKTYQTFTMEIASITFNTCKLELMWEHTKIAIPIKADNEAKLDAAIDKAFSNPNLPYFQAANYYYETDQHLDKAEQYVNKAVEQNPNAFFMWYLKARIEKKMGHKQEAIAAAKKSMETAKGAPLQGEYMRNNQKLIDEMNK